MIKEANSIQKTISFTLAGLLLVVFTSSIVLPSQPGQTVSAMNLLQAEDTATPTATLENTPTPTFTSTPTVTPTFISGVLTCNTVAAGVTCTNYRTYLDYNININVTGLTGGATASSITIGTYKRSTSGGNMGMMSDFIHSETSIYSQNKVFSMVRIKPFDAARVDYASFTSGAGTYVQVTNSVNDWRYIAGTRNYPNTLSVRGNVDWPITGYSVVGHIYLYSNQNFVTVTPTSTPTLTPTSTATSTPTVTPIPNRGGSGTCWASGASWPDYDAYYSIDSSIPSSWVPLIESAAATWTNITPSHFSLSRLQGSPNFIDKGPVDKPELWIAITYIYATSTTPITLVTTTFDETDSFDIISVPDSYHVENVMTHEFGHWLQLKDISTPGCEDVTMWHSIPPAPNAGETKKITLESADIEGANWQYP